MLEGVGKVKGEFGLSWIFDEEMKFKEGEEIKGKLALSMCPGKVLKKGRDGKSYERNIAKDVWTLKT